MEKTRCFWASPADKKMLEYHDFEYGRKKDTDRELFEKFCLEAFQAGLSWRTVLYKREALRKAFFDFDIKACAELSDEYLDSLKNNEKIIRNARKIYAVRTNARALLSSAFAGSFHSFVYSSDDPPIFMQALRKAGFTFCGVTICESFLMSVGAVEGHEPNCFLYGHNTEGK